jgi:hypothetical protein
MVWKHLVTPLTIQLNINGRQIAQLDIQSHKGLQPYHHCLVYIPDDLLQDAFNVLVWGG